MKRIGIFGGTFSPFTVAHREIVKTFIDLMRLDELYIIPTIVTYHREGKTEPLLDHIKLEIIERVIDTLPLFYVRRVFLDRSELSYRDCCRFMTGKAYETLVGGRRFLHTLIDFNVRHGLDFNSRPFVCIGTDSFENIDQWYMNKEITKVCNLVVVQGRNDKRILRDDMQYDEIRIPAAFSSVSASKIREAMRNRTWPHYINDIKKLDAGEETLSSLGWC